MLEFAHVEVGEGAPLGCARCGAARVSVYYPADEVAARISAVVSAWTPAPGPNLVLSGPEPFAHPALPDLVTACVEAGVERIAIETDGGALAVRGHAAGALGAGVTHLRVRVLAAGDDAAADALTGRPGLARAVASGVVAYRDEARRTETRVAVSAIVPVCRHNLDVLPATVARLATWGIDGVRLVPGAELSPSAGVSLAAACDTGMVNRLWVEADPALGLPESHALHSVEAAVTRG